jgi:membrane peptidoglycan carboxypeptidase
MKLTRKILTVVGLAVLGVCLYYAAVVVKARRETPGIMRKALGGDSIKLKLSGLNRWQVDALLAVEDPGFYCHNGVDLKTPGGGLTTITQGLVKIFYFDHFKPGIAKRKQTLIAMFALDPLVSKEDQLTLFINYIYLGNARGKLVYGFEDAARAYYGKPFRRLTRNEYLSIIAMINAPKNFNILTQPKANTERTKRIWKVVSGEYRPKSLMDQYYGKLDEETQKGLAPASYYPSIYEKK